jgi:hypothetical protein
MLKGKLYSYEVETNKSNGNSIIKHKIIKI